MEKQLRTATSNGETLVVQKLLRDNPSMDINQFNPENTDNPLTLACWKGHVEIVKLLLNDDRIDINVVDSDGLGPLHLAFQEKRIQIAKLLLSDERTNLQFQSQQEGSLTPFQFACFYSRRESIELVNEMKGKELTKRDRTLMKFVRLCFNKDIDVEKVMEKYFQKRKINVNEMLLIGCSSGNLKVVQTILSSGGPEVNLNFGFWKEISPFYVACRENRIEVVSFLINLKGVDVNKKTILGASPFYVTCQNGHTEVIKLMLQDQRVDVNSSIKDGATPFYISCWNEHIEIVKLLLNDQRTEVNKTKEGGFSPFYIACQRGLVEIVKLLLANPRVDINLSNKNDATPLFIACQLGQLEVLKLLLNDKRVDIHKRTKLGATPFFIACQNGYFEIVKLLAELEIDVNQPLNSGQCPLYTACSGNHVQVTKFLLSDPRINVNCSTQNGGTPISIASQFGHFEIVKLLLDDKRVDVNIQRETYGATPFFLACFEGHLQTVKLFLASERDVDVFRVCTYLSRDAYDQTIFNLAEAYQYPGEKEEIFLERQENFSKIINLLDKYKSDKQATQFLLRKEFGVLEKAASQIFCTIVLLCMKLDGEKV